jgi:hypothetical protein
MSVPTDFASVLARVKRVLSTHGRTLVTREPFTVFEVELKHNGKVKHVPDLEKLARELEVMEPFEVPSGEWAEMKERAA